MNPVISVLVLGIGALLWLVLRQGAARLSPGLRRGLGLGLIAVGIGLAVLRQFGPALALGALGLALVAPHLAGGLGASGGDPSPGGVSEVGTDALHMTLDHDTGAMEGEVLTGPFAGRRLSELGTDELDALLDQLERDEESLELLLAWLDRTGRAAGEADGQDDAPVQESGPMSEAEAYRVLGLEAGASVEEVRAAYRRLIRKVHPDLGGSAALTAMLNAAKDRLDAD